MKSDRHGCSTCPPGQERWEWFEVYGKRLMQYDYRTPDGELFSQVFANLECAHLGRDAWLADREKGVTA